MAKSAERWADDLENKPVRTIVKAVAIVVAVVVVIFAILWGFGVVSAPWKGKGDAYREKESAQNWINAQRTFHQQFNDVQAYQAKIASAKTQLDDFTKVHPNVGNGTPFDPLLQQQSNLQTTVTGLQQSCQNTVADYNTNAQSYLTQDWRDAGLPEQLDLSMCG